MKCQLAAAAAVRDLRATSAAFVLSNEEAAETCGTFGAGALDSDVEESDEDSSGTWQHLEQDHQQHKPYREKVLQRWGRKAMLSKQFQSGTSFKAFNKGVLEQIEEVLQDRTRLVRRTQLRRGDYTIIGDTASLAQDIAGESGKRDAHLEQYDEEIFDDQDYYSKLLRELIESGTKGSMSVAMAGNDWLKKSKRKVDTKASKGRKLRYDVHAKIVNFMPAIGFNLPQVADELFGNLFGTKLN